MTVDGHFTAFTVKYSGNTVILSFFLVQSSHLQHSNTPQVSFKHKWQSNRTTSLQAAASIFEKISVQLGTSDPSEVDSLIEYSVCSSVSVTGRVCSTN